MSAEVEEIHGVRNARGETSASLNPITVRRADGDLIIETKHIGAAKLTAAQARYFARALNRLARQIEVGL